MLQRAEELALNTGVGGPTRGEGCLLCQLMLKTMAHRFSFRAFHCHVQTQLCCFRLLGEPTHLYLFYLFSSQSPKDFVRSDIMKLKVS